MLTVSRPECGRGGPSSSPAPLSNSAVIRASQGAPARPTGLLTPVSTRRCRRPCARQEPPQAWEFAPPVRRAASRSRSIPLRTERTTADQPELLRRSLWRFREQVCDALVHGSRCTPDELLLSRGAQVESCLPLAALSPGMARHCSLLVRLVRTGPFKQRTTTADGNLARGTVNRPETSIGWRPAQDADGMQKCASRRKLTHGRASLPGCHAPWPSSPNTS